MGDQRDHDAGGRPDADATESVPVAEQPAVWTSSTPGPALSDADRVVLGQLPATSALLVIEFGGHHGGRFLVDTDVVTVGRDSAAALLLDDATVSRKHAEIARVAGGFELRDCGSLNGSYVNGHRVDTHVLVDGDVVQVGKFRMRWARPAR